VIRAAAARLVSRSLFAPLVAAMLLVFLVYTVGGPRTALATVASAISTAFFTTTVRVVHTTSFGISTFFVEEGATTTTTVRTLTANLPATTTTTTVTDFTTSIAIDTVTSTVRTTTVPTAFTFEVFTVDTVTETEFTFSTRTSGTRTVTLFDAGSTTTTLTTTTLTTTSEAVSNDPNNDDEPKKKSKAQKLKDQRTNDSNEDDERTEGNIMRVERTDVGLVITIGTVDGEQLVVLKCGSSCPNVPTGKYLSAYGVKIHEGLFEAENIDVD
jgi:hypothetical protein